MFVLDNDSWENIWKRRKTFSFFKDFNWTHLLRPFLAFFGLQMAIRFCLKWNRFKVNSFWSISFVFLLCVKMFLLHFLAFAIKLSVLIGCHCFLRNTIKRILIYLFYFMTILLKANEGVKENITKYTCALDLKAQVIFSGPEIFYPKFWELSKLRIWQQVTGRRC